MWTNILICVMRWLDSAQGQCPRAQCTISLALSDHKTHSCTRSQTLLIRSHSMRPFPFSMIVYGKKHTVNQMRIFRKNDRDAERFAQNDFQSCFQAWQDCMQCLIRYVPKGSILKKITGIYLNFNRIFIWHQSFYLTATLLWFTLATHHKLLKLTIAFTILVLINSLHKNICTSSG
jgi:hypothetical protein